MCGQSDGMSQLKQESIDSIVSVNCILIKRAELPDVQLSADEIFDRDSFSESIMNALPSGL